MRPDTPVVLSGTFGVADVSYTPFDCVVPIALSRVSPATSHAPAASAVTAVAASVPSFRSLAFIHPPAAELRHGHRTGPLTQAQDAYWVTLDPAS